MSRNRSCHVVLLAALIAGPQVARAQGVRGWVASTTQMVELRPLGIDTVPLSLAVADSLGAFTFEGQPVKCVTGALCTRYQAQAKQRTIASTQDINITAWGFGVQGLSITTLARARVRFGGDILWPRSDDEVDVLLAFAQWVHGDLRLRMGRQELRTGLGFPAFDGAFASWRVASITLDGYSGRSLARGLREPSNAAFRSIEPFVPDASAYLFGAAGHTRFLGSSVTARYQREILSDRSGLVSERASLDLVSIVPGARITAALDYDFAFDQVGKSHLTVSLPLLQGHWLIEATGRRYVPYFELSTIWGFFRPVPYSEMELRTAVSSSRASGAWVSLARRQYGDAEATVVLQPLEDTGWKGDLGVRWAPDDAWQLEGQYRVDWVPGGFLNSLDASARYAPSERLGFGASLATFQQIEEFRVGDGRAYGGSLSFDIGLNDRLQVGGGLSVLRHRDSGSVFESPWNQARGWTSLRVAVGSDPGLARTSR